MNFCSAECARKAAKKVRYLRSLAARKEAATRENTVKRRRPFDPRYGLAACKASDKPSCPSAVAAAARAFEEVGHGRILAVRLWPYKCPCDDWHLTAQEPDADYLARLAATPDGAEALLILGKAWSASRQMVRELEAAVSSDGRIAAGSRSG